MSQVTTSCNVPEVCTRLLGIPGVFSAFAAQGHRILCHTANDPDLAEVVVTQLPPFVKNVILTTPQGEEVQGIFGSLRTTITIFDRIALVLVHGDDSTYGVTVHKEHATPQLVDEVYALVASE